MKRFYEEVTLKSAPDGVRLKLDGRAVKTPAKLELLVPSGAFAEALAKEWREQGEEIDPKSMPLTRLANSVIDGVADRAEEVRTNLYAYGETDLIYYWAESPETLVDRQRAAWQPILDWAVDCFGAEFAPTTGLGLQPQDPGALSALKSEIDDFDLFSLAAIYEMTSLTGSVLIAVAVARDELPADAGWDAAHVDETFQIEQWGEDEEAKVRQASRRAAYLDAVRAIRLLKNAS